MSNSTISKSTISNSECAIHRGPSVFALWVGFSIYFLTALTGCSISNSSDSFSNSSNSISDSLSNSSDSSSQSSTGKDSAYIDAVREYTVASVRMGDEPDAFLTGLGHVAASLGVTDWESLQTTFEGVGAGFAEAGISQAQFAAYSASLSGGDAERWLALRRGFDRAIR